MKGMLRLRLLHHMCHSCDKLVRNVADTCGQNISST